MRADVQNLVSSKILVERPLSSLEQTVSKNAINCRLPTQSSRSRLTCHSEFVRESHNLGVTMFTSKWRHLCISCLLLILPLAANPADLTDDCGRLLSGPQHVHIVYVLCPSLPELDQEQAHAVVMAVLDTTTRRSGDTLILFFANRDVV